jgi:ribose transport system ATP-binding protein
VLSATGLVKRYGGVAALDGAGITLAAGEIHALVGENGAGKSTMVKILSGVTRPDAGQLTVAGTPVRLDSPRAAADLGIAIVAQELALFPDLTVLENLFCGQPPTRWGLVSRARMAALAAGVLDELGLRGSPAAKVGTLSLADRQLVEVSRALLADPRVLILDEPTSALPAPAVDRLTGVLRRVADRGIAVLYISHILEEVRQIAGRVTVLRDGRVVTNGVPVAELSLDDLVTAILGQRAADQPPGKRPDPAPAERPPAAPPEHSPVLRLDGVGVPGKITDVSLSVAPHEIVGLAGLEGSGHVSVAEVVCGLLRPTTGTVRLPGGGAPRSLRDAVSRGVALVPGDRRRLGLMLDKSVWENATAALWLGQRGARRRGAGDGATGDRRAGDGAAGDRQAGDGAAGLRRSSGLPRRERLLEQAGRDLSRMRFRGDLVARVGDLSGGNQQKVVFAKWIGTRPSLLVLDDPTRGVDVGARAEMHEIVRDLAAEGRAILVTSTDLPELVELCDRVVVFQRGTVVGELSGADLTEARLATAMNAGFTTTRPR